MGFAGAGRFLQSAISRQWAWSSSKNYEAHNYTPTSGSFSPDKTGKAPFDWEGLDYGDEDDLDKARGR